MVFVPKPPSPQKDLFQSNNYLLWVTNRYMKSANYMKYSSLESTFYLLKGVVSSTKLAFFGIFLPLLPMSSIGDIIIYGKITYIWRKREIILLAVSKYASQRREKGWGLGEYLLRNWTLLGKWFWRFLKESTTFWHKVILSIHETHQNDWDTNILVRWTHC